MKRTITREELMKEIDALPLPLGPENCLQCHACQQWLDVDDFPDAIGFGKYKVWVCNYCTEDKGESK